jgi:hypothetical protein
VPPGPPDAAGAPRRGWRRFSLPDRLEVVIGDRSGGGAPLVSFRFRSRLARIALAAASAVVAGGLAWALAAGMEHWLAYGVPVVVIVNAAVSGGRRRIALTDAVLGHAAARAAVALGHQRRPGQWVIEGPEARALGRELARLHGWWTLPGHVAYGDGAREQALLAAAAPELRAFMRPTAHELEPDTAQPISHRPGDPWPMLGAPGQNWPMLPPGPDGTP